MPFQTHEHNGLIWLTSAYLCGDGLRHGFSTRTGGVSPAPWDSLNLGPGRGDGDDCLQENYRRLCAAVEMDVSRVVLSRQVHEDNIRLVTAADAGKGLWQERDYSSVDAMICNQKNIPLVVFGADCGIILLYDPVRQAIGAVHAGWRGVAQGLVHKTVLRMEDAFGTDPADLCCAIGPSIGQCCFETDDDVPAALQQALGDAVLPYMERRGTKWHIDLKGINALWLQRAGVAAERIDICSDCTGCLPQLYWSHRKLGEQRGNQCAIISLV